MARSGFVLLSSGNFSLNILDPVDVVCWHVCMCLFVFAHPHGDPRAFLCAVLLQCCFCFPRPQRTFPQQTSCCDCYCLLVLVVATHAARLQFSAVYFAMYSALQSTITLRPTKADNQEKQATPRRLLHLGDAPASSTVVHTPSPCNTTPTAPPRSPA